MMTMRSTDDLVVVGGRGAVGQFVLHELGPHFPHATAVDLRTSIGGQCSYVVADVTQPTEEACATLRAADVIVLALPEYVAIAALPVIVPLVKRDALLVETLSVKSHFATALRQLAPLQQAVGINPLFRPDGPLAGQSIAIVNFCSGPQTDVFRSLLARQDARLWELDAEAHDRIMAGLQVVVHAAVLGAGLALDALGTTVDADEVVGPRPYEAIVALLRRILSGTAEVYREIQASNPYAEQARVALQDGIARLQCASESAAEFDELFERLSETFGCGTQDSSAKRNGGYAGSGTSSLTRRAIVSSS
jgi:prephenate dehydrogenase